MVAPRGQLLQVGHAAVVAALRNDTIVHATKSDVNARFAEAEFTVTQPRASGNSVKADRWFLAKANTARRKADIGRG